MINEQSEVPLSYKGDYSDEDYREWHREIRNAEMNSSSEL